MKRSIAILVLLFFLSGCVTNAPKPAVPRPTITPTATATQPADTATPIVSTSPIPSSLPTETPTQIPTPFPPLFAQDTPPTMLSGKAIHAENVYQVAQLARWGKGSADSLAYSPDGSVLAVSSSLGIDLYDVHGQLFDHIETNLSIGSMHFSPDGKTLIGMTYGNQLEFWRWKDKILQRTIHLDPQFTIYNLAFSSQGDRIGFLQMGNGPDDTRLKVLQITDERNLFTHKISGYYGGFQFSPDGQSLYIANNTITKYRLADGTVQKVWNPPQPSWFGLNNIKISSNEKQMVASDSETIYLWNLADPAPYQSFSVQSADYDYHNYYFASSCHTAYDEQGPHQFRYSLSPDNQMIAVNASQGSVQIRQMSDGAVIAETPDQNEPYNTTEVSLGTMLFHPRSQTLTVMYSTGLIETRNLPDLSLAGNISGYVSGYSSLAFSPEQMGSPLLLAAGASDSYLRIWEVADGRQTLIQNANVSSLAFSPDGALLAFGSRNWMLNLLRLKDNKLLVLSSGHEDWINGLAFSPDGRTLISGSRDCTFKIWNVGTDVSLIRSFEGDSENPVRQIQQISLSPDGVWMMGMAVLDMGSNENGIILYNTVSQGISSVPVKGGLSAIFSPDGQTFASLAYDRLEIWNFAKLKKTLGVDIDARCMAYSPDGNLLAVGMDDGTISLRDSHTLKVIRVIRGHRGTIEDIQFSPDGSLLATGASDGTLRIWGISGFKQ
jgi:WD40 repeat protein